MLNLDKNKKYLLACSYGPDSMALFSMLLKEGYNFIVAHVNYHFRNESDLEERGLREFAKEYNVALYVYDNKEKVNKNLEARAREIRYRFFNDIYQKERCDYLLVAQHEDDLLETYLMQKNRNLHPICFGIRDFSFAFNMNIVRPLLSFKKEELLEYCQNNNVPYAIDSSNNDLSFTRNKIRHEVVAKLNEEDRLFLLKEIELKNQEIEDILNNIKSVDIHSCKTLVNLNEEEYIYAIQALANECQIFKISQANMHEITKIIHSKKPNVILTYKTYSFIKEYDKVYFLSALSNNDYSYQLDEPGKLDTPYFYLDFTNGAQDRNVSKNDYPLLIRNAKKNDVIKIKDYEKECRRLFIDWKMPLSLRKRWPVIVNKDNRVIYIPRYQKSFVKKEDTNFYVK